MGKYRNPSFRRNHDSSLHDLRHSSRDIYRLHLSGRTELDPRSVNPINPYRSLRSGTRQPYGGKIQNQAPSVSISTVNSDCQKPQYHAEKTTANHAMRNGVREPSSGSSALRNRSAATAARIARI